MCWSCQSTGIVFKKKTAQHSADFKMLLDTTELEPAFINADTKQPKQITCIRVYGASDEGPSHQEVQFWWTEHHLSRGNYITLVTTRNRVELQNGCLTQGHSNLFIPSTLKGSCCNEDTGAIDQDRLKANLDTATDMYINRCNQCSSGDTVIHLFKDLTHPSCKNFVLC